MICKKCNRCGLCPGIDGTSGDLNMVVAGQEILNHSNIKNEFLETKSYVPVGIALDLGTTTLAFAAFNLQSGERLYFNGQPNSQRVFGSDVISRISVASQSKGFENLHNLICTQINNLVTECFEFISTKSTKSCVLEKFVICGNTTMVNLLCNIPVTGLAKFPFYVECNFGKTFNYTEIIGKNSFVKNNFEFYIPPVLSPFVGADFLCAVSYCCKYYGQQNFYLCDMGTNSEIGFYHSDLQKVFASSTSAGPCFEGVNMECGSAAIPHAASFIGVNKNKSCFTKTFGGGETESICGSGYLSGLANFYINNLVDENANIISGNEEIFISHCYGKNKRITVTQKDIRNLQLAKGAIESGIKFLMSKYDSTQKKSKLFMAGGFGSSLEENSLLTLGVIPNQFNGNLFMEGNLALKGLVEFLFDSQFAEVATKIAKNATCINLAEEDGYQQLFLNCLNFPPLVE